MNRSIVQEKINQTNYDEAKKLIYDGNVDEAIDRLRGLVEIEKDKEKLGLYKIFLAQALYNRGKGSDIAEGINIFKEVATNSDYSKKTNSASINSIASIVFSRDSSFYKTYFTEKPFSDFYPSNNTDKSLLVREIYLNILKYSDDTYPNSYAKYAIASEYGYLLFNNKIPTDQITTKAELSYKYVSDGDSLKDDADYSNMASLKRYLNRATSIGIAGKILNKPLEEREAAYKLSVEKGASLNNLTQAEKEMYMRSKFFYASFLVGNYDKKRSDEIKVLLKDFSYNKESPELWQSISKSYFESVKKNGGQLYERVLKMTEISPEFKKFITDIAIK